MSCKVHLHTPQGVDMYLDYTCIEVAEHEVAKLLARGYTPVPPATNGHSAPAANGHTPPPSPAPVGSARNGHRPPAPRAQPATCPKHGAKLDRRFKYGEAWVSHPIEDASGTVRYCRGQATGKAQDGWEL